MNFKNLTAEDIKFIRSPLWWGLAIFIYLAYTLPVIVVTYLKWGELSSRPIGLLVVFYGWGTFATVIASMLLFAFFKVKNVK